MLSFSRIAVIRWDSVAVSGIFGLFWHWFPQLFRILLVLCKPVFVGVDDVARIMRIRYGNLDPVISVLVGVEVYEIHRKS